MKDHIVHIGLPKTATSFFQERVFPRFEGVNYISPGFIRDSSEFNHLRLADDSLYDPAPTRRLLEGLSGQKILLSEERFSGRFLGFGGAVNRSLIARRLHDLMPDARILLFLRGQPAYIYSAYQQYIKGYTRGTLPFEHFIHAPESYGKSSGGRHFYDELTQGFTPHYIFYHELLTLYTSLFKEVKILLFEDFVREPERILGEIESFVKPANSLAGQIDWKSKKNTSYKRTELHSIRYMNSTRHMGNRLISRIFRELLLTLNYRFRSNFDSEKAAAKSMSPLFVENNLRVIRDFPEAGIQHYPQDYPASAD